MRSSRYQHAKEISECIGELERRRAKTEIKRLVTEHKSERKMIRKAHTKEMAKFEEVWQNYFIGLRAKEQSTLIRFRAMQ